MTSEISTSTKISESHVLALLTSAIVITLYLFYLDEGYYNFKWMSNPGNWIMFVIYVGIFFSCQFLVSTLLLKRLKGLKKTIFSILGGGIAVMILVLIIAMFTSW